jgi:hypothetical protein
VAAVFAAMFSAFVAPSIPVTAAVIPATAIPVPLVIAVINAFYPIRRRQNDARAGVV